MEKIRSVNNRLDLYLHHKFYDLGIYCAENPKKVIGIVLLTCLIFMAGNGLAETESRGDKLWIPQENRSKDDQDFVEDVFGQGNFPNNVLLTARNEGDNVLTLDVFDILWTIDRRFRTQVGMIKHAKNDEAVEETYDPAFCARRSSGGPCDVSGPLAVWKFNETLYRDTVHTQQDLLDALNDPAATDVNGFPINLDRILSERTATNAVAIKLNYPTLNDEERSADAEDNKYSDWEQEMEDYLEGVEDSSTAAHVYYSMAESQNRAFSELINGDLVLLAVGYVLLVIFMCLILGRPFDKLEGRVMVGVAGVLSILAALYVGYGLSSYFQVVFTPLTNVLPFILLGIGVDDIFIFVNALDEIPKDLSVTERIGKALSRSGSAITVTSVSDCLAFLIGSASSLPAITAFCQQAALAILALFFLQITFFVALMTFDTQRQVSMRADIVPCIKVAKPEGEKPRRLARVRKAVDWYGDFITRPTVRICVLVAFATLFSVTAWGASQLERDLDFRDFVPSDSFVNDYLDADDDYFNAGVPMFVVTESVDYAKSQVAYHATYETMVNSQWTEPPYRSWYEDFAAVYGVGAEGLVPEASFYTDLETFLASEGGQRYQADVKFADASNTEILATRMRAIAVRVDNADERVDLLDGIRSDFDDDALDSYAYSRVFIFFEQYKVIVHEAVQNLGLALVGVFVVTFFLLSHPGTALLVILCIVVVDVNILGFMYFWDLTLNSVTVVGTVVAVGLAVDYAAHIAHGYMVASGTRVERVRASISDLGFSVLCGGFSTFLAVFMLAFSNSFVFIAFFRVFFILIVFGLSTGIVLLPVLLCYVGTNEVSLSNLQEREARGRGHTELELKHVEEGTAAPTATEPASAAPVTA